MYERKWRSKALNGTFLELISFFVMVRPKHPPRFRVLPWWLGWGCFGNSQRLNKVARGRDELCTQYNDYNVNSESIVTVNIRWNIYYITLGFSWHWRVSSKRMLQIIASRSARFPLLHILQQPKANEILNVCGEVYWHSLRTLRNKIKGGLTLTHKLNMLHILIYTHTWPIVRRNVSREEKDMREQVLS